MYNPPTTIGNCDMCGRENTLITPVIEVDGREKYVDNHYFNEKWSKDRAAFGLGRPGVEARSAATSFR